MSLYSKGEAPSRIQTILESFSDLDGVDIENKISDLVKLLDSLSDSLSEQFNQPLVADAYEVVEALSYELPNAVSKFAGISDTFMAKAIDIVDQFIHICTPKHMLLALCHTLDYSSVGTDAVRCIVPTLSAISKVLILIKRRQFEHISFVVPTVLNALKAVCWDLDKELVNVFKIAVDIAKSIEGVCDLLDNDAKSNLRALLGLYVLQCLALVSASETCTTSSFHSVVQELSKISSRCGLSYLRLVTEYDVEAMASSAFGENKDDCMGCLSHVMHGAALSVVWGHVLEEFDPAVKKAIVVVKDELLSNQIKRWKAIGTLQHVLSSPILRWELKEHTINFLLCITNEGFSGNCDEVHSQWPLYMPKLISALQVIERFIIRAPNEVLCKNSLSVLKRVLADIPISQRLGILNQLIKGSDSSFMIAIWVGLVKMGMHKEIVSKGVQQINNKAHPDISFWTPSALESVDWILRRPPQGGLTSLPEKSDAVFAALNFYIFVFMRESTGKTNYTQVLLEKNLVKVYNELLLPLRTFVIKSESYDADLLDMVLCWCMELVEDKLNQGT